MSTVMVTGQTSVSLYFYVFRTSTGLARDGTLETALAYNTAGLSLNYVRERAAIVSALVGSGTPPVTLAAATTAWTQWGFIHVGAGIYRVDYPDAAFATGVKFMIPTISGSSGLPADTSANFLALVENTGVDPRLATPPDVNVTTFAAGALTALAAAVWNALTSGITTAGSIGKWITDKLDVVLSTRAVAGDAMALTSGERTTLAASIWNALTSGMTTAGSIAKRIIDNLDVVLSTRAATGAAMTLTSGERTSIAAAVELAILNEADGSAVQQAIVDKINATDTNLAGLTLSAIAQACRDVSSSGAAGGSMGALVNSIYSRIGAPAGGVSMSADIALLLTDLLLVMAKTNNLPSAPAAVGDAMTLVGDLTPTMKASVNAEIVDALINDTYTEPASTPAATSSIKDKISYIFTKTRNKVTQTAGTQIVRNDGDTATIAAATVSDDGTTFVKGKDA